MSKIATAARRLLAALAATIAAAAVIAGALVSPGLASASVTPGMDAHATGWLHPARSPADIEIGEGGSPYLTRLVWVQWGGSSAYGTGKLHVMNPDCTPTYLCKYHTYSARVWLHRVITHRGVLVFSRMRWIYGRAGHVQRLWLAGGWWTPGVAR